MTQPFQSVRGMRDIFSDECALYEHLEARLSSIIQCWGYQHIRLPIIESEALFRKSVGEGTDLIDKEMYCFEDQGRKRLTLRPEGTAGAVRAAIQHGLAGQGLQKWFYLGPMFRRERPQAGRYRQFNQLGVEVLGASGPGIVSELIMLGNELLDTYADIKLHLNYISEPATRQTYIHDLKQYLWPYRDQLDQENQKRLTTNPLRILDSKCPSIQDLLKKAPVLKDYWSTQEQDAVNLLKQMLSSLNITYQLDHTLVRGLDYYNGFVFEWHQHDLLGSQSAVAAGGCYDHLVSHLSGPQCQACGFALGIDRLVELSKHQHSHCSPPMDGLILAHQSADFQRSYALHRQVRAQYSHWIVGIDCREQSLKSLLKRSKTLHPRWVVTWDQGQLVIQHDQRFTRIDPEQWLSWLADYSAHSDASSS